MPSYIQTTSVCLLIQIHVLSLRLFLGFWLMERTLHSFTVFTVHSLDSDSSAMNAWSMEVR